MPTPVLPGGGLAGLLRRHARLVGLLVTGCVAVGVGSSVVRGWRTRDARAIAYAEGYAHALVLAHTRHAKELQAARDSLARLAARVDTVWRTRKAHAESLVAQLPPLETRGDTIVLTEGRFVVAHPVAVRFGQMATVIAVQDTALHAASQYIGVLEQKDRVSTDLLAAKDSVNAGLTLENAALQREVKALTPSGLASAWSKAKVPLAFVVGAYIGARATR